MNVDPWTEIVWGYLNGRETPLIKSPTSQLTPPHQPAMVSFHCGLNAHLWSEGNQTSEVIIAWLFCNCPSHHLTRHLSRAPFNRYSTCFHHQPPGMLGRVRESAGTRLCCIVGIFQNQWGAWNQLPTTSGICWKQDSDLKVFTSKYFVNHVPSLYLYIQCMCMYVCMYVYIYICSLCSKCMYNYTHM